jgi:protein tyrosine phosphatase (PTP) superfamily phosphohydrolase (DUF442 family)
MMMRRGWKLFLVVGLTFVGCKTTEHQSHRPVYPCQPPPCDGTAVVPRPLVPAPQVPPPGVVLPGPGAPPVTPAPGPGPVPPGERQSFAPPQSPQETASWRPLYEPGVRLLKPEPLEPDAGKAEVRISPPSPLPSAPPPVARINPPEKDKEPVSPLPVGIAHFTELKANTIATGFRPHPTDGIPWLQEKGFRSIVYLRDPGVNDANDRRLIEKYGLKYYSLEVSPDSLSRELVAKLKDIIAESNNVPLFVYDKDGTCTGAMFYLYLRQYDSMSDEAARVRAARLGLKDDESPGAKAWWTAIQGVMDR